MFMFDEYVEGKLTGLYIGLCIGGLIVAVILGFVCRNIVKNKNYPDSSNHGFAWGFWLGIIGLVVCVCKPNYFDTIEGRNAQGMNPNMQNMNNPYGYPPQGQNMNPQYGAPMNGAPQQQAGWQCSCGRVNDPNSNFCSICGSRRQN